MRPVVRLQLGFLLTSLAVAACGSDGSSPTQPSGLRNTDAVASAPFTSTMTVAAHTRLRLEGINGSVTLTGSPGVTVTVDADRHVGSDSFADAQASLPQLHVEALDRGTEILVRTTQPQESGGRNYVVDYRVKLPSALVFVVTNVNGAVRATGMAGGGSVSLVNGSIDAALALPPGGTVDLTTVNGEIALDVPRATSARLSARLTNGAITLTNLTLQGETRTSRSLEGTLGGGDGEISLQTTNGAIRVTGT